MYIYKWHEGEQWSVEQNTDMLCQNVLSLPREQSSVARTCGYTANTGASAKTSIKRSLLSGWGGSSGSRAIAVQAWAPGCGFPAPAETVESSSAVPVISVLGRQRVGSWGSLPACQDSSVSSPFSEDLSQNQHRVTEDNTWLWLLTYTYTCAHVPTYMYPP